jgi:hypothetical protein
MSSFLLWVGSGHVTATAKIGICLLFLSAAVKVWLRWAPVHSGQRQFQSHNKGDSLEMCGGEHSLWAPQDESTRR